MPHNATARRKVKLWEPSSDTNVQISTDAARVLGINNNMINDINDFDKHHLPDKDNNQSIYDIKNATVNVPMKQDLNCKSTIKSIIDYYVGLTNRCLQQTLGCDTFIDTDGEGGDLGMSDYELKQKNTWAADRWDQDD